MPHAVVRRPIRHTDHVKERAAGGETAASNLGGLCEACNHAKNALGWHARPRPGPRHTIETTTPTGHTYRSQAPPLPGTDDGVGRLEIFVANLLLAG